jgi:hypothetical protein
MNHRKDLARGPHIFGRWAPGCLMAKRTLSVLILVHLATLSETSSLSSMTSTEPVAGVWKRLWEEDPLGDSEGADRDTLVLWTQAPKSGIYVDLRLPAGSPGRSIQDAKSAGFQPNPSALEARGFSYDTSKVNAEMADILCRQKSFAGFLKYSVGDTTSGIAIEQDKVLAQLAANAKDNVDALSLCTCFWRRDIDFQPPSGGLDVGVCASEPKNADGSIDLRETGDDASYAEGWRRLPKTGEPPFMALQLVSENGVERDGFWVRAGRNFAYAIGRPKDVECAKKLGCHENSMSVKDCVGKSLCDAVKSLQSDLHEQLQLVGSYVVVYGEVSDSGCWTVLHGTDPCLVGCTLVGSELSSTCCSKLDREAKGEDIQIGDYVVQQLAGSRGASRKWKLVELDGKINLPLP